MKKLLPLSALLGALVAIATSAQASIIINETWADGERATQDLANNSMAWFNSGGTSALTATAGSMTRTGAGHVLAYFTEAGSPVTIAVGEAIQLRFSVSFPGLAADPAGDFRAGLFNSTGADNRVSADSHGGTNATPGNAGFNPIFIPYTGYISSHGLKTTRGNSLWERLADQTGGGAFIGSTSAYSRFGSTETPGPAITQGSVYYGTLLIDRVTVDSVEISYTLKDGTTTFVDITRMDEIGAYFTFDTVGFSMGSNTATSFVFEQVEISIIPEPSTIALLLGFLGLVWVLARRRRI